jgi:hypothetical protein
LSSIAPLKSICDLDLPLDESFNFTGWRKILKDMEIPDDMMLPERNQYNYEWRCTTMLASAPPEPMN